MTLSLGDICQDEEGNVGFYLGKNKGAFLINNMPFLEDAFPTKKKRGKIPSEKQIETLKGMLPK